MIRTVCLLACFILSLLSVNSNAQEVFSIYQNTYSGEKYPIAVAAKGNVFTLYIYGMPNENSNETGGIIVKEDNYYKFIDGLKYGKLKYEDAIKSAKEKGISSFDKTLRVFGTVVDAYFKQDKIYVQKDIELGYRFKVQEINGKLNYLLFVDTGILTALNNTGVHSAGHSLVFSSSEEIDQFIHTIKYEKIDSFVVQKDSIGYIKKLRKLDGSWHSKAQSGLFANLTLGAKVSYTKSLKIDNLNSGSTNQYALTSISTNVNNNFNIGLFGRIDFNKIYFQPELLYEVGSADYSYSLLDFNLIPITHNKAAAIRRFDLPLLVGYKIGNSKNMNLRVFAGPKFRWDAGSTTTTTYFHTEGNTNPSDMKIHISPSVMGLETGLGVDFSGFTLDLRYVRIKDMYPSQLENHTVDNFVTNNLVVSLGWKIFRPRK